MNKQITFKFNYQKLKCRIREICGNQREFANAMGLSERSISLKLNNARCWTQQEIYRAIEILKIEDKDIKKYFFIRS